jgi:hypothetical protein
MAVNFHLWLAAFLRRTLCEQNPFRDLEVRSLALLEELGVFLGALVRSLYRVAMVGVYFSGATAPTCLYTVPTLTPKRRVMSLTQTSES